jgi:hypothetical protein
MDVARQRFASLFDSFGGWRAVRTALPGDMQDFMHTDSQSALAAFVHHCWQLRCSDIPDEFAFGDCVESMLESSEFVSACDDAFDLSPEVESFLRDMPYEPAGSGLDGHTGDA